MFFDFLLSFIPKNIIFIIILKTFFIFIQKLVCI